MNDAWIIGGGLAGATSAYELARHDISSSVFEMGKRWGGLVRSDTLEGVIYEPHGSHLFHTDDEEVWRLVTSLIPFNSYEHRVQTLIRGELLTWPIQADEIERVYGLKVGDFVESNSLDRSTHMNFEEWCLRIMPEEVYDDFIKPYTEKQWGRAATELSASFAPKRVQVRTDGDDRLFKDRFQGFPDATKGATYEAMLRELFRVPLRDDRMHTDTRVRLDLILALLKRFPAAWRPDVIVITVPLDDFCMGDMGELEWRGLDFEHKYIPLRNKDDFFQERMVVNWPDKDLPWIRTHETKHASGQRIKGTVLSTEFPGGKGRYYPVPGANGSNRKRNERYQEYVRERIEHYGPKVVFTGRLSSFAYFDMDDVIRQALDNVRELMRVGEQLDAA